MKQSPASFSHPAWIGAVMAQMPDAGRVIDGAIASPFVYHVVRKQAFPFAHAASFETSLTPCSLPSATAVPSVSQAQTYLNHLAMPVVLRTVPTVHPVTQALLAAASHKHVLRTWERAGLNVSGTFENWMMTNFDHRRRKELKRLKARLAELGDLRLESLEPGGDLDPHIKALLAVEQSGWKGRSGTAIANDPQLVSVLENGLAAMHALGNVRFWTLRLDGSPVASLFALVDGDGAVLGKIGFDEAFARFSPGVLIVIAATECLFADRSITFVDANSIPDHPMIDRLWRDRRPYMDVVLAGKGASTFSFKALTHYLGWRDMLRSTVKRYYLKARVLARRESVSSGPALKPETGRA